MHGFTLVELLVAIAILGLFASAAFGAVRTAGRSLDAGLQRANTTEVERSVSDFLRRQLAQLTPTRVPDGDESRLAFAADRSRLKFIAPAPQYSLGAGLLVLELVLRKNDGHTSLVLKFGPFDPGAAEFEFTDTSEYSVLAEIIGDMDFQYFGAEIEDDRPTWKSEWRSEADLYPTLVRLRPRSGGDSGWPELVFSVQGQVAL
jgi:general secretion pathway protein J